MGKLADRAKELSPWIRLKDGESVIGVFKSWEETKNSFGGNVFAYTLEVNGDDKVFQSGSLKLAEEFDAIGTGKLVKITRDGEGSQTKWKVEEMADEEVTKAEAKEITEEMADGEPKEGKKKR